MIDNNNTTLNIGNIISGEELKNLISCTNLTRNEQREKLSEADLFTIPVDELATHTAIFGTTQGGKTTTTKKLILELNRCHIPVMVIDWHNEYASLIKKLNGIVLVPPTSLVKPNSNLNEQALTWNILDPRFYSDKINSDILEDHIELIVNLLSLKQILNLTDPMKNVFINLLKNVYNFESFKGKMAMKMHLSFGNFPTFHDVNDCLNNLNYSSKELSINSLNALKNRINKITTGTLKSIFCTKTSFNPQLIFKQNVAIQMNHLTEDFDYAVSLLTFFILRQLMSHFKKQGESKLRYVIVIDEAPSVLSLHPLIENRISRMLQELRKFGIGLIIVARNTDISKTVLRETNQKFVHRLQHPEDVNNISKMIGLKNNKFLVKDLPPGVCFVKSSGKELKLLKIKL